MFRFSGWPRMIHTHDATHNVYVYIDIYTYDCVHVSCIVTITAAFKFSLLSVSHRVHLWSFRSSPDHRVLMAALPTTITIAHGGIADCALFAAEATRLGGPGELATWTQLHVPDFMKRDMTDICAPGRDSRDEHTLRTVIAQDGCAMVTTMATFAMVRAATSGSFHRTRAIIVPMRSRMSSRRTSTSSMLTAIARSTRRGSRSTRIQDAKTLFAHRRIACTGRGIHGRPSNRRMARSVAYSGTPRQSQARSLLRTSTFSTM